MRSSFVDIEIANIIAYVEIDPKQVEFFSGEIQMMRSTLRQQIEKRNLRISLSLESFNNSSAFAAVFITGRNSHQLLAAV